MFVGRRAHIQVRDALQRVVGMLLKRIPSLLLVPSRQILLLGTRQEFLWELMNKRRMVMRFV